MIFSSGLHISIPLFFMGIFFLIVSIIIAIATFKEFIDYFLSTQPRSYWGENID